jgi:PAS domain S-box-containing protein
MSFRARTYDELSQDLERAQAENEALRARLRSSCPEPVQDDTLPRSKERARLKDSHADTSSEEKYAAMAESRSNHLKVSAPGYEFQHLVASVINYAIFAMDNEGIIVSWNLGAERMKRWKADEIIGKHLRVLYTPEEQAAGLPEAHLREAAEKGFYQGEGKRMRKGGELFDAFVSLTPILDEDGTRIGFTKVTQEVTEQKKLEAQRQTIADLTHARMDRERQVSEDKAQALTEAGAHKDEFLSILSHELRTPINAIMGFGSILDDEISGPLNQDQHRYTQKILSGSETLLALIDDLLDMSRIQAGKFSVAPRAVDFRQVVNDVSDRLHPMLNAKACRYEIDIPADLPPVMADDRRVGQVLSNLITNAVKYSPGCCAISVSARVSGEFVRCEVCDRGAGISEEDRARLFLPFSQLDMSTTRSTGGVGLGLSIVKALVEAQGGEVGIESEVGQGSTFWFTLPLA